MKKSSLPPFAPLVRIALLGASALSVPSVFGCSQGSSESGEGTNMVTAGPSATPSSTAPVDGAVVDSAPIVAASPLIVASELNNYDFSSTLTIDVVPVAPSSELTFDWAAVNTDFIGHGMDPVVDIDMVTLLMWKLNKADLERKLNADELAQSDLVALAMIYTEDPSVTSGSLFDMTSFGDPLEEATLLDYLDITDYDPASYTYTIMAATGTVAGEGTRMIQGFQLDPSSTNTQVTMNNTSTGLQYTVDISSAAPSVVPAATPGLTIDWDGMTLTSLGTEFNPNAVTGALVAKYPLTVDELEANFLDLELIAEKMYRADITSGTSFDLSQAKDETGATFPGVDASGTWVVALFCGDCANPAPWYLSVLQAG